MTFGSAPGKVILFGEHAVVYGRPALAAPVNSVQARAEVVDLPKHPAGKVRLEAPQMRLGGWLHALERNERLVQAVGRALELLEARPACALLVRLDSSLPVAAGLGSSAAVSVALLRGLSAHLKVPLTTERLSELSLELEKFFHGTPSGIDTSVIAFGKPVYFVRGQVPVALQPAQPLHLVIADSGQPSDTMQVVGEVRAAREREPERFEQLFDAVGKVAGQARERIETGQGAPLGPLMDENHVLLVQMGVSSERLDGLVDAARQAGAQGAKLSGAGRGGNIIALVTPDTAGPVGQALRQAGAVGLLQTAVEA
jgi:mevalonate kinase